MPNVCISLITFIAFSMVILYNKTNKKTGAVPYLITLCFSPFSLPLLFASRYNFGREVTNNSLKIGNSMISDKKRDRQECHLMKIPGRHTPPPPSIRWMRVPSREGWPEGPGCVCLSSKMIFLSKVILILVRTSRNQKGISTE
jgi:hypothetical protein